MEENEKIVKYLSSEKNPYQINVENIVVTMEYNRTGKKFDECIYILKRNDINK